MKTKKQIGLQEKTKNKKQALKSLAKSREGITRKMIMHWFY